MPRKDSTRLTQNVGAVLDQYGKLPAPMPSATTLRGRERPLSLTRPTGVSMFDAPASQRRFDAVPTSNAAFAFLVCGPSLTHRLQRCASVGLGFANAARPDAF